MSGSLKHKIITCPNVLHVDTVGTVTRPVTHVAVVAVNNASIKLTLCPFAVLIGKQSKAVPARIANKKLSKMICVVDN